MRSASTVIVGFALAATAWGSGPLEAQDSRRRGGDRERLEQRIREQMGRMMQERLELSEAEADELSELVRDFDRRRRTLYRSEQAVRREVEEAVERGDVSDAEALVLLRRIEELEAAEADLLREEQAALLEILTPVQVLELRHFRDEIGRRIRELRGNRRGDDSDRGERRKSDREPGLEDSVRGNVDASGGVPLSL